MTLIVGTAAIALAWSKVTFGWIVSGLLAVILGRDVVTLLRNSVADPGVGLWMGAVAFAIATAWQMVGLFRSRTRFRPPEEGDSADA